MAACYSVKLVLVTKDEEKTKEAMRNFIFAELRKGTAVFDTVGKDLNNLESLVKVFITNNDYRRDGNTFTSCFDASYGWEGVLLDMFSAIAPTLEDTSQICVEPDNDYDLLKIVNGKVVVMH